MQFVAPYRRRCADFESTVRRAIDTPMVRFGFRMGMLALTIVVTTARSAFGQGITDLRPPDTTFGLREGFGLETLFLRPASPEPFAPAKGELEFSLFLRQSLFLPDQADGWPDQNLATLQWMWKDEIVRGSEYQTLREIVGAVEFGAVAYLAYRHLKRYGLK